jgi:hypothetical protein
MRVNSELLNQNFENKTSTNSVSQVLVKFCLPTAEWAPTLSAGRKILVAVKAAHYRQPQSFGDMVLTDRGLTTPEIAQ